MAAPSPLPLSSNVPILTKPLISKYAAGDDAFSRRNIPEQARRALALFREYHKADPQDPSAAWRHSMGCYFAGLHIAATDNEKKSLFAEGREAGLESLKADPNCAPCHFWTAINMALYGQAAGVFKMFFTLGEIQDHLHKTAELEPGFAGAGAYRLLGLIQQKLPGILGGSNEDAKQFYELAIKTAPNEPLNYLFLTKLLREKYDDLEGARETAIKGVAVPKPSEEQIEALGSIKELQEFLALHPAPAAAPSPSPRSTP